MGKKNRKGKTRSQIRKEKYAKFSKAPKTPGAGAGLGLRSSIGWSSGSNGWHDDSYLGETTSAKRRDHFREGGLGRRPVERIRNYEMDGAGVQALVYDLMTEHVLVLFERDAPRYLRSFTGVLRQEGFTVFRDGEKGVFGRDYVHFFGRRDVDIRLNPSDIGGVLGVDRERIHVLELTRTAGYKQIDQQRPQASLFGKATFPHKDNQDHLEELENKLAKPLDIPHTDMVTGGRGSLRRWW